jgi:hypothetical protein
LQIVPEYVPVLLYHVTRHELFEERDKVDDSTVVATAIPFPALISYG